MFFKIWKDSVWSEVLAAIIFAILSVIYATILKSIEGITFINAYKSIFDIKVRLAYVILVLFIFYSIKSTISYVRNISDNDTIYNKSQQILRGINTSKEDDDVSLKWEVFFDHFNKPFIGELTAFCDKHNFPLRFIRGSCPERSCSNHQLTLNEFQAKNAIESMLIAEWDKIKNKP